jgi:hypothetical protein
MTTTVRGDATELIPDAVERCLDLAGTWYAWDGRPRVSEPTEDIPGGTVFTPHKAIRRIADHLVDHLAQIEALLAGAETIPTPGTAAPSPWPPTGRPSPRPT